MPGIAGAKILLADDDQSLVRTLSWILKHEGYEVVVAPGGEGLLAKLEEERPHLLLLDIMMPQVDGLQLQEIGRDTSELQSRAQISYAVFCLKKKNHSRQKRCQAPLTSYTPTQTTPTNPT